MNEILATLTIIIVLLVVLLPRAKSKEMPSTPNFDKWQEENYGDHRIDISAVHQVKYEYRINKYYGLCGSEIAYFYVNYKGIYPCRMFNQGWQLSYGFVTPPDNCLGNYWVSKDNDLLNDMVAYMKDAIK